jgi:hypothetical protein
MKETGSIFIDQWRPIRGGGTWRPSPDYFPALTAATSAHKKSAPPAEAERGDAISSDAICNVTIFDFANAKASLKMRQNGADGPFDRSFDDPAKNNDRGEPDGRPRRQF